MADRSVIKSGKDSQGDITSLCGNFGSVPKATAISDIEHRVHTYHVNWQGGKRTEIRVVEGRNGKYLRTDWDNTERNNLDDLDDC